MYITYIYVCVFVYVYNFTSLRKYFFFRLLKVCCSHKVFKEGKQITDPTTSDS